MSAAERLERTARARPALGESKLPGSFGDGFEAKAEERGALARDAERSKQCLRAMEGTDEPAKVQCESDLAPTKAALEVVLNLAMSEMGGTPPSAHPFAPLSPTAKPLRDLLATCTRGAVEAHSELRRGRPAAASSLCTRGLGVARDFAMGASLAGGVASATCMDTFAGVCGRALDALSIGDRTEAKKTVQAIAETLPPFAEYADAEAYSVSLFTCGSMLEPGDRARLGPLGRAAVAESERTAKQVPPGEAWMQWPLCRDGLAASLVIARAYREPRGSAARAKVLAEGSAVIDRAPVRPMDPAAYEERLEKARATLRALAVR